MTEFLTTKEAAAVLRISPRGVLKLIREGRLKAIWALNKYLVRRDSLDNLVPGIGGENDQ